MFRFVDVSEIIKKFNSNPENFKRVQAIVAKNAYMIRQTWMKAISFSAKVPIKQGGSGWWGRNMLASGNFEISFDSPFRARIEYKSTRSSYDFFHIVENGRPAYDIVSNLLARSKKVRITKDGRKILIVPLPSSKEAIPDFEMAIDKFAQPDNNNVLRNKYQYVQMSKGGQTAMFTHIHEKGGSAVTKRNLITISENSSWNPYPKIQGTKSRTKMEKIAKQKVESEGFQKEIAQAFWVDISDYFRQKHPEIYKELKEQGKFL